jgi:ABC-type lipoprotein export system ATPase subunit
VIATHNRDLAERADRVLHMKEGQLRLDETLYPAAGDDAV